MTDRPIEVAGNARKSIPFGKSRTKQQRPPMIFGRRLATLIAFEK
jgi:hypothetical protein